MSGPTIEAVELTKTYGSFMALDRLNLKLEGPKCVGFLGPNGAGKTTTLKIFTDLIRRSSGEALINGVDVHADKKKALAAVAALVETPEIYPVLTPKEALLMIAEQRGVPAEIRKKKIEEALCEVRMDEWGDKKIGKFSKGMKQRIDFASTLLNDPEIVILDEPTSGLDPRGMSEIRETVKDLKKHKRLIFMSSHLLPEVMDVCDEVAMVDHGRLIAYDAIQNLIRKSTAGTEAVEIGFQDTIGNDGMIQAVQGLGGIVSVEKMDERSLRIRIRGGPEVRARVFTELGALNIGANSFRPSSSGLEEAYLNLVKGSL